jgi:hypothetical protein
MSHMNKRRGVFIRTYDLNVSCLIEGGAVGKSSPYRHLNPSERFEPFSFDGCSKDTVTNPLKKCEMV